MLHIIIIRYNNVLHLMLRKVKQSPMCEWVSTGCTWYAGKGGTGQDPMCEWVACAAVKDEIGVHVWKAGMASMYYIQTLFFVVQSVLIQSLVPKIEQDHITKSYGIQ